MKDKRRVLLVIVVSQFCCTSLWFAGNGVMGDLIASFALRENALGHLTSSVQLGFIFGTLLFAFLSIADRFSPSKVFLTCALLGALSNLGVVWEGNSLASLLSFRFMTGFFLAGIYPVGMKIAADYFQEGLGKSLGFLVGALVLGTALPHLLKSFLGSIDWKVVLGATSSLAVFGGLLMGVLVKDGPHRKASQELNLSAFLDVFRNKDFRSAAFGYFGHMWELYAFWVFVPVMLQTYVLLHPQVAIDIPTWSFLIIGVGGLACVLGGFLSMRFGTKKIATLSLLLSLACCLASPLLLTLNSKPLLLSFLLFWGMVVIADSPLFSTLVANNAEPEIKGTALTIVNCIGFAITIVSIQLLSFLNDQLSSNMHYLILALGPFLGLIALRRK